ncbi:MAG: sulfite exporter TauE/SafE family protein [Bacillota bacterium]|nr:sulfite exporter TauE/SafE family protein [Bacillota bacterium]
MCSGFHYILQFFLNLFLLKYLPDLGTNASYGLLFIFGVLTSFHCLGMCGGIAISQTIKQDKNKSENSHTNSWKFYIPSFQYNIGRVISYTIIGGIVGGIGNIVAFSGVLKGIIPILGGVFMIIMAINLLGIFPVLRRFNIRMPLIFGKKIRSSNNLGPLIAGLLSGLMPCGPLQIIQLYALGTRSIIFGAISMFFFSLGTVPVIFVFGAVNSIINKRYSNIILKASATLVVILGVVMISRGLSLVGVSSDIKVISHNKSNGAVAKIDGNIQVVTMNLKEDSYEPIIVQKGILVRWIIKAKADKINDCNNTIIISKLKIEKSLVDGDNIIEFTPIESGEIPYACWMGMINSKITVVDDIKTISSK